ncbi:Fic family protein [Pengzhenrongella sicca]|uniref:Fic family protein n=1 Tax=Pengzhenrongella sicca TaxID=2819238 RepID=A0A8A4ZJC9_9MICO|nr:Fic family protein [Pengzhenrongella sicca]QTE29708.1 Fic family protein [Pengzhenrongella sicca]
MTDDALAPLAELPGVADAIARARVACEELRWHEAFRRRWRAVRAEATVRSARASAAVEGARVPVGALRDALRGAAPAPLGADGRLAFGALRAAAEVERLLPDLGARDRPAGPPFGQLLARLHAAATADIAIADGGGTAAGRPRGDGAPRDLGGLGPAPAAAETAARLDLLGELVRTSRAPALVLAAVVHGELLALRPFAVGSGLVARAAFRLLVAQRGLDPTGAVVADIAWLDQSGSANVYLGAAAGFATGTPAGVAAWLIACADAVRLGADEGRAIADAVLAGRLEAPAAG